MNSTFVTPQKAVSTVKSLRNSNYKKMWKELKTKGEILLCIGWKLCYKNKKYFILNYTK